MFSRGKGTLEVSAELFAENRRRLVAELKGKAPPRSVILLQGGVEKTRYHTDAEDLPFRQESFFFWTFGVFESECYGAIDVDTGRSWLFPPRLDSSYAIWDGKINDEAWFQKRYAVDAVNFHEGNGKNMADYIQREWKPSHLLLLRDKNSDSKKVLEPAEFDGKETFPSVDIDLLSSYMVELRVHKTDRELEVMRYASKIACEAHMTAMKHIRPGHYEYQMESLFRHYSYYHGGCRHLAYTCIAASGENGAILHYGHANAPNDKMIRPGDMCLFDMGPEYCCYSSDVTSSFPVSGKFTEKQKTIYNAVLEANRTVFKAAKAKPMDHRGGYLFAVVNPFDSSADVGVLLEPAGSAYTNVSLILSDSKRELSAAVASFLVPQFTQQWTQLAFSVRRGSVTLFFKCSQFGQKAIPLLPDLVMGDAHKLYIGGAGPIIGSGFELGAFHPVMEPRRSQSILSDSQSLRAKSIEFWNALRIVHQTTTPRWSTCAPRGSGRLGEQCSTTVRGVLPRSTRSTDGMFLRMTPGPTSESGTALKRPVFVEVTTVTGGVVTLAT